VILVAVIVFVVAVLRLAPHHDAERQAILSFAYVDASVSSWRSGSTGGGGGGA
jgi:hypothetical protein